jgi:diguanylate cyclase (GGDEF)-like protein
MILDQIFNVINVGIVVLDRDLRITYWNRWMELHSGISAEQIVNSPIFLHYPELENPKFVRNCKAVLNFGNFSFFSQKLHRFLFPLKPSNSFGHSYDKMLQNCTLGPVRDERNIITHLFITVQDVTELVAYETMLIEMNMRDGLTGIFNRRFFESKISEEFSRHKRYARPFALILCDIDYFKKVNDTYGHQCGDEVLKAVATTIQTNIRETDILARYGGEEFCCLLPETELDEVLTLAERLRQSVAEQVFSYEGNDVSVTVSLGISVINDAVETQEMLVAMADEALYEAKRTGRNRVILAGKKAGKKAKTAETMKLSGS